MSPERIDENVKIEIERTGVWSSGEIGNISWNPYSLVINDVMSANHVRVDITLSVYNSKEVFEETIILATDLPNSGSASVLLPDSLNTSLPRAEYDLHVGLVKVGVNTSTTSITRYKRNSGTSQLLGKLGKFAKLLTISSIKDSIAARLLCEVWVAATPNFPTRDVPPCACNSEDAEGDDRYEEETTPAKVRQFFHPKSSICYRQANVR